MTKEQLIVSANRDTDVINNIECLIGTYADKRNAIINLIKGDYLDDADDLIKYQTICDKYEEIIKDLVRIHNKDRYAPHNINVNDMLAFEQLGGCNAKN